MAGTEPKERLEAGISRSFSRKRIEFILRVYTALGALTAVLGLGYFLFSFFAIQLTQQQRTSLLISGVGVVLAVMSKILIAFFREREVELKEQRRVVDRRFNFIVAWERFESLARSLLEDGVSKIEDGSDVPMRSIFYQLVRRGYIEAADLALIERALSVRNLVAHGQSDVPSDVLIRSIDDIERIQEIMLRRSQLAHAS